MEDDVGFEPTVHFCTTVFKTVVIDQLGQSSLMVDPLGLEPRLTFTVLRWL